MYRPDLPGAHSPLDYAVARRDADLIDMVRRAIDHGDVMLAFQPVVQAADPSRIAFHEGLVRVLDDTGRIVPAFEFIPTVEETEYGRILDSLALEHGLEELAREPGLRLSINMSARSIGYPRWQEALERGLREDETIGERLILEITERSSMLVPELVVDFMTRLQRRGISFAIDDFGAGFTALRYFKDLYFDILKIHGQFTAGIAEDADNQVLVRAMLSIAEQFDMFTIAEAVETFEDACMLEALGVDCLQGYFFGAPTVTPDWQIREDSTRSA